MTAAQIGPDRAELAAYERSMALGAGLGVRPAYPLTHPAPADGCGHGPRCRRCALYDGDWHDFGPERTPS